VPTPPLAGQLRPVAVPVLFQVTSDAFLPDFDTGVKQAVTSVAVP